MSNNKRSRKMIGGLLAMAIVILALPASVKADLDANDSALLIQGTNVDKDIGMLTQFYGLKNDTLNSNSISTPNGWSLKLSGTYKGKQLNVNYLGDTSQFSSGIVTWTSSGFYGSDLWSGSGSALITNTGETTAGRTFQVNFQSSLNIGSHTGSSKDLINGTENASEIKYISSVGTDLIDGVSRKGGLDSYERKGRPRGGYLNDQNYGDHTLYSDCDADGFCVYTPGIFVIAPSISGTKFNDKDGNGIRDVGEEGLAGWHIRLVGFDTSTNTPVNRDEITDANGNYGFMDVTPGIYQVFEVMQGPNWVPTTSVTVPINLKAGETINVNFGNKQIP